MRCDNTYCSKEVEKKEAVPLISEAKVYYLCKKCADLMTATKEVKEVKKAS